MVKSCAAYNCRNRFEKCKPLNFHRFPLKNEELCKKWVIATRRQNFTPNESSYICRDHFTKTDDLFSDSKRLKASAIPSIFDFPTNLNKNETPTLKRKEPFHRELPSSKCQAIMEPTHEVHEHRTRQQKKSWRKNWNKRMWRSSHLCKNWGEQKKKIGSLRGIISDMRDRNLLDEPSASALEITFSRLSSEIIKNHFQNNKKTTLLFAQSIRLC